MLVRIMLSMLLAFFIFLSCTQSSDKEPASSSTVEKESPMGHDELVERGSYLVTISGCNDCHTPKIFTGGVMHLDSSRLLSGHVANSALPEIHPQSLKQGNWISMAPGMTAFVGPWGLSYASNITPDSATGIGALTEVNFINALRTGKHFGLENGRPIMPPMPWPGLSKMTDQDLSAVYAYLRSLPPVSNRLPEPQTPEQLMEGK